MTNEIYVAEPEQITLTKFNPLPVEVVQSLASDHCTLRMPPDTNSNNDQRLPAENCNKLHNSKFFLTNSGVRVNSNKLDQNLSDLNSINNQLTSEPFQIVWRHLSFEVKQKAYENPIKFAMNKLTRLWRRADQQEARVDTIIERPEWANSAVELAEKARPTEHRDASNVNQRVIFENLNGYSKSGEITAILGPSGAGKTTLLNAICGRSEHYRGSVQLIGGGTKRMQLSIIPQKDYLMENLTVRETLLYASRILNLPDKNFNHETNIMRVVKMLNLAHCLDSSTTKISGGEYKRVSIAQELLRQPDILVLDEPTSGLDSLNCKNLIRSLIHLIEASRNGSIKPLAVVMTIHQPDVDIFQMFDHVYCMARGGRVIFDGHPSEVLETLRSRAGFLPDELPPGLEKDSKICVNLANLLIEIASEHVYGREPIERLSKYQKEKSEKRALATADEITSEQNGKINSSSIGRIPLVARCKSITLDPDSLPCENKTKTSKSNSLGSLSDSMVGYDWYPGEHNHKDSQLIRDKRLIPKISHKGQFWRHTYLLTSRAFRSTVRDQLLTTVTLIFHLSLPFGMWSVYSPRIGSVRACPIIQHEMDMLSMVSNNTMSVIDEQQDEFYTALECCTLFFLVSYALSCCSLMLAALAFPLNMHVMLKEVRNGWYNLPTYVTAKTLADAPFEVCCPVISVIMIYCLLDMPESYFYWRLWVTALTVAILCMFTHTQGLIFGAVFMNSVQAAIFLACASTLPQTMTSGFTARIKNMPFLLQKMSWLSIYHYSTDALNIIRFGYGICPCDSSTVDYLKNKPPVFTDITESMKPAFTYYLTNAAAATSGLTESVTYTDNQTIVEDDSLSSIPGISYQFSLNSSARAQMVQKLENNELDVFSRMAELMARSFSYGRELNDCNSVRSQLLASAGTPADEHLPNLLLGMVGLLVLVKILLYFVVRHKVGSRV